ncbi:MAG: hypothetical protein ACTSRZ_06465 [Promethearchaeota archaeon]
MEKTDFNIKNEYNNRQRVKEGYIFPRVGYVCFYHPFEEGAAKALDIYKEGLNYLQRIEIEIIESEVPISDEKKAREIAEVFRLKDIDVLVVRLATWCSDSLILDIISIVDVPVVNWGLADINSGSMCGAQQFNAVLKELEKNSIFIYKDREESILKMEKYIYAVSIAKRLKRLRIGIIGNRTQGMSEVICDELSLKEIFGVRIISIRHEQFKEKASSIKINENDEKLNFIKENFNKINVDAQHLNKSLQNYYALKDIVKDFELEAVTVDCYPDYMGSFCLGFSFLSSEYVACACEGDINSALLMWVIQNLTKFPTHHIDPLYVYEEDNSLIGSHCGSGSILLADQLEMVELGPVRLAHKGVCVLFPSKPGIITMANFIGRKKTYRMAIITAEAIKTRMEFPGNPIKIKFPFSIQKFLDLVEIGGFGHHWVVGYGDIAEELLRICDLFDIDALYFNNQ